MSQRHPTFAEEQASAPGVDRLRHRRGWSRPVLAVLGFWLALYGPWLLLELPHPRHDALRQSIPWFRFAREEVMAGRLPVWDPSRLAGTPHMANIQAGFFYPPNLLLLPLPPTVAVGLVLVGHVLLGGVLLTLFARSLGLSAAPSALAGMAYVSGAFVSGRMYASHVEVLRAMAWAPLLLLAARGLALGGGPGWAATLAAGTALSLLAGYPGVTAYSLLAAGALFLVSLPEGRRRTRAVALGAAAMGVAALLAAPALVPLAELAGQTTRSGGLTIEEAAVGALRPADVPTLLWPWFLGAEPLYSYWGAQRWQWAESKVIGGMGLLALALVGLVSFRRERAVAALGVLAAAALVLSFGPLTPFYTVLHELAPPLRLFRIPTRWGLVAALALPVLAGFGLQALLETRVGGRGSGTRSGGSAPAADAGEGQPEGSALALAVRLGLGASAVGLVALAVIPLVVEPRLGGDRVLKGCLAGAANVLLGVGALAGLREVWRRRAAGSLGRRALTGGVCAVVLLDLVVMALPALYRSPESLEAVVRDMGPGNLRALRGAEGRVALGGALKAYANLGRTLGFESATGYDPLLLGRTAGLLRAPQGFVDVWGNGANDVVLVRDGGATFDVLGVSNYLRYSMEHGEGPATLLERRTHLPRLSLVGWARRAASQEESLAAVLAPGFDPRAEVVLEEAPKPLPAARPATSPAAVEVLERRPGLVRARVEAPDGGYLVFSESYYPGWRVEAGGREAALVPADHAAMAARLAPGGHDLTLRFTTPWLWPSLGLCAVGLAALAGLVAWSRRMRLDASGGVG